MNACVRVCGRVWGCTHIRASVPTLIHTHTPDAGRTGGQGGINSAVANSALRARHRARSRPPHRGPSLHPLSAPLSKPATPKPHILHPSLVSSGTSVHITVTLTV